MLIHQLSSQAFRTAAILAASAFSLCILGCGGEGGNTTNTTDTSPPGIYLLAGSVGGYGTLDGSGGTARFYSPQGLTVDASGNLYVSDSSNNTIRKISPDGTVITLAGFAQSNGNSDGSGTTARFYIPTGLAVDAMANIYVADTFNHTIRKVTPTGVVTTVAGAGIAGSADGIGTAAQFDTPMGLAFDAQGVLYIADAGNNTIRKMTPDGTVTTFAGTAKVSGSSDDNGTAASFSYPTSIAIDGAGSLYVADTYNYTVRKITAAGAVTTLAGGAGLYGNDDGKGGDARFSTIGALTVGMDGNVYVSDTLNRRIRKITPAGDVSTYVGSEIGSEDGAATEARFAAPLGLAQDKYGNIFVADSSNNTIRKISPAGTVSTIAGSAALRGSVDASGSNARFWGPSDIVADDLGNAYIADSSTQTIRKITASGAVSTIAGAPGIMGSSDGAAATARFNQPSGIARDTAGNLYIADTVNHTIRVITTSGTVTTIAGAPGISGSANGTGSAARFNFPIGIAIDGNGNIYVTEQGTHSIRKVTPAGVVSTFAGSEDIGGTEDGTGSEARFFSPRGLAVDSNNNLYVASGSTIRKITQDAVVTTYAGNASISGPSDSSSGMATFQAPHRLAFDATGNLYVTETFNGTVRKISRTGVVSTVAGTAGQIGIVLGNLPGNLSQTEGVIYVAPNSLWVSSGSAILKIKLP